MGFVSSNVGQPGLSDHDYKVLYQDYCAIFERVISRVRAHVHQIREIEDTLLSEAAFVDHLRAFSDGRFFNDRAVENNMLAYIENYLNQSSRAIPQQSYNAPRGAVGSPLCRTPMMQNNAFGNLPARTSIAPTNPSGEPVTFADHLVKKSAEAERDRPTIQRGRILSEMETTPVIQQPDPYYVVPVSADIDVVSKYTEVKDVYADTELMQTDMTVNFKHPFTIQWNNVILKTPAASVITAIRILKEQCPDMFYVPQWIMSLEYDQLYCQEITGKETNIAESFKLLAEKASIVKDIDTFMTIMVPALKSLSGENGIINTLLKNVFNEYLINYFRNPMEPSKYHQIETWVDLNEILTKQSSVMQPWTQAAANYEQLIFKFLYSSMKTVLQFDSPEGARVSSENVHNAGMFASMPKLQIAEGKHLLRDYGNMTPAIWKKMSAKLDAKYVLYKTRYKIVVTNLGDELITGDSESPITIIPPKNIFSPIHVVANVIMKKSNPEEGQILPLSQVVQYDDKTDSIVNTVTQGSLIGTGLIYF